MTHALSLGEASLDHDHARLQQLILDLQHAAPGQGAEALAELHAHARQHFGEEDKDLILMADGNSQCHLDEHAAVLKSLGEVEAVLAREDADQQSKTQLLDRLARQLLSWLPEHVQEMDAAVATHRSKQRFGGAPVTIVRRAAGA